MSIRLSLVDEVSNQEVSNKEFGAVPQVGTQVMVLDREWQIYGVTGIQYWPVKMGNDDDELAPMRDCSITVYVKHLGAL